MSDYNLESADSTDRSDRRLSATLHCGMKNLDRSLESARSQQLYFMAGDVNLPHSQSKAVTNLEVWEERRTRIGAGCRINLRACDSSRRETR